MERMRDALTPVDDGKCFACGPFNEDGLKLRFERDGDEGARGSVTLDSKFQGYRGIAHGGIVMMLLDEVMAHASGMVGEKAMTASVSVRFRKPVPTGEPLTLRGKVLWQRRSVLSIEGVVIDANGEILASAEGSFVTQGRIEPGSLSNLAAGETV
ncbi:MAG: PaaI family thioesterase [Candidatus Velthaea sp.]